MRDAAVVLPAESAARTERTTLGLPRFIALRNVTSAFLESFSLTLAALPGGAVAFARLRPIFFLPIRSFATAASLQGSLQRAR